MAKLKRTKPKLSHNDREIIDQHEILGWNMTGDPEGSVVGKSVFEAVDAWLDQEMVSFPEGQAPMLPRKVTVYGFARASVDALGMADGLVASVLESIEEKVDFDLHEPDYSPAMLEVVYEAARTFLRVVEAEYPLTIKAVTTTEVDVAAFIAENGGARYMGTADYLFEPEPVTE